MNRTSTTKRAQVLAALAEGVSINATPRMTGVAKHTILNPLKDLGCAAASYHNNHIRNLRIRPLQCDEIWAFVYGKDKNLTIEQAQSGLGSVWTWTAIDADTELIVSYMLGDRGAATAQSFMRDLAGRIANRIQLTTDGHRVYADAVVDALGADIDYAMLVKIYDTSNDNPESRYSPATCMGCRTGVVSGQPDPRHQHIICRAKPSINAHGNPLIHAIDEGFSKKLENRGHAETLYFMHYNFWTVHKTLRVYSRDGSGLTDHIMDYRGIDRANLDIAYPQILARQCTDNLPQRKENERCPFKPRFTTSMYMVSVWYTKLEECMVWPGQFSLGPINTRFFM